MYSFPAFAFLLAYCVSDKRNVHTINISTVYLYARVVAYRYRIPLLPHEFFINNVQNIVGDMISYETKQYFTLFSIHQGRNSNLFVGSIGTLLSLIRY